MVARGEIWWHESEVAGRRPYLVMSRDETIPVARDLLAIPATSRRRNLPAEVPLDAQDGMPGECVLRVDQMRSIRATMLTERITRLGPERLHEVCLALRAAIRC